MTPERLRFRTSYRLRGAKSRAKMTGTFAITIRDKITMPHKPAAYYRPTNLDEALRFLRQPNTLPLAGGTALLATEEGIGAAVVDLQNAGLDRLNWADDGRLLRIGAMVRLVDEVLRSPRFGQHAGLAAPSVTLL